MESSDEELFNSHFSPDSLDKMVNRAPLKGHKLRNMESSRKTTRTKEYQLRERTQSSANFTQVSEKVNRMEALCKLLCKPVSVKIVKLSVSELQRWTKMESKSCNDCSQGPLIEQRNKRIARQTVKQSSRKRKSSIPPREEHVIKKIHITDVLTDIKLPYIKVCRIDKILGEVVPNKECEIRVQTEYMDKSPVELSTTDPEQLRSEPLNANESYNQCVNDKTSPCNNASSGEYAADKDESSDDDQVCQNFNSRHFNRRRRRRRRVIYDSNDDSNNAEEVISQKEKSLKSVCRENVMGTYIPNDQNNVNEAKYADESETLQKQLFQKLDIARILSQQSSYTSEATSLEFDLNNVSNNVEKRNASTCAPLELNFACSTQDNIPLKLDNANSRAVQERILKSKDIPEPMEKSSPSDKDLIERYKLFKELRVSLIKFNSAKSVKDNKYSATERQQLTAGNINDSTNTKFLNNGKRRSDLDLSEHSNCHTGSRKSNPPEPTQQILNLNSCCTPNRYTSSKEIQNVTESSSDNLMKSSSMSSETEKLRGTNLNKGKACHNLVKRIGNSSKEMSEKDTTQILEQESVVSLLIHESTSPPSSPHDSDKTLKLSNSVNDIVDSEKSENILHARSNQIPPLEEDISELLTPKLTPIKDLNTESRQKSANASTRPVDFKTVISQQNDTTLKPKRVYWIVSHKSAENISGTKSSTKKNSATCHSSTISSAKHRKPMDKRNSKGCIHKCIVCDSCFNDYSDLRKHLVMHTQKKKITSSTLSTPSKSSIRMSEQFRATTRRSSETGVAAIIQPSEQNSDELVILESVADSGKKRKTKTDTLSKCSPNKSRRKKGLKKPPASDINECTICSQIFPTETDLAAHIFLHTEKELQNAYKIAKQKLEGKESKRFKTMEKVTDNVNNAVDSNAAGKSLESLVPHDSETGPAKSTTLCEKDSKSTEFSPPIKLGKEKMSKRDNAKKCFRICNCHNKPGTNDNCLRIEIVHLCHTCRVLFRSMECLETHYDMPEYAACNQNRLCKSPNLFCSTCGMVFGSVQHVRHHLEIHARFKQGCTMEFRCNICKLIFIGIGAQFYIHWSNHTKDPSWIATEESLPDSIIIAKPTAGDKCNEQSRISSNRSVEGYLQIAEYICHSCKLPFINNAELKDHISICKSPSSDANTSILKDTDVDAQKYSSVKIVCSLCDKAFTEGLKFYKHITHDHEFNSEPQFTCVSLTTMKRTFICSLCMNVTESIDEFEDHWLLHCTRNVLFTCTCGEISRNSFNSFLEHVKEHTIEGKVYVPSCTVSYEDTKTICTQCNLGFESPTAYDQHAVIHKSSNDVNSEEDEVTKTKQKLSEVSSITYNTNRDKENLIRILEGSDDSEPELVIDLTAQPEACKKSSEKEENVQTRYTPTRVSVAGTWTPSSERSLPITKTNIANASVENENRLTSPENVIITEVSHHVTEAATVPVLPKNVEVQTSMITVSSPDTDGNFRNKNTEILKHLSTNFVENVHDNEGHDTALIRQQETPPALDDVLLVTQSTPSKKQSPPKPRKGFLRVKTLAELTGSAGCSYNAAEKNNEKCTAIRDQLPSAVSEKFIQETSQYRPPPVSHLKLLNPTQNLNASSTPPPVAVQKARVRVKAVAQSNTAVIGSKNAQQLQESINRRAYMSAPVESVTSTCHTNLPPHNMPRRTTSVPRSLVESNRNMTNDMIANSANTNMPKSCNSTANRNQPSPSFSNVIYTNDDNYRYKCKFCSYCTNSLADCLLHDLPDPNSTCQKQYLHNKNRSNQTVINNVGNLPAMTTDNRVQNGSCHEGCQPITINQQMKYPSPPAYNQYPHLPSNSSNGSNYMFQRNHQIIIPNKPLIDNASSSICYNNSNFPSGGVIIANNQTHSVQSIPTIGILQQPAQHMYQAPVCTGTEPFTIMDPSYVQQQQVYQIFQPKM